MLRAGLRRLAALVAGAAAATAAASLALGALVGASPARALPLGFDVAGAFCVFVGFLLGNRGAARFRNGAGTALPRARLVRWASPEERLASLSDSALFVVLGLVLVLVGLAADTRRGLW